MKSWWYAIAFLIFGILTAVIGVSMMFDITASWSEVRDSRLWDIVMYAPIGWMLTALCLLCLSVACAPMEKK